MTAIRNNWTKEEIAEIYHTPLLDLIYQAATIHRENKDYSEVQVKIIKTLEAGEEEGELVGAAMSEGKSEQAAAPRHEARRVKQSGGQPKGMLEAARDRAKAAEKEPEQKKPKAAEKKAVEKPAVKKKAAKK